ncbi:MAG: UMP kinase [Chloroflexi bacterium]|jgi:uridylate kinase|nr:UMP kinase [Chloroflexota bacterium]MDP6426005.1 UMP kinase [Dehalococcoidia bacterium]
MDKRKYSKVLLKLSGESFKGDKDYGLDIDVLKYISNELSTLNNSNVQLGVVVGGGNIWRGVDYELTGMDRATADSAGMLATIMNALSLQDALEKIDIKVRTQSSINITSVAEPYIRRRAIRHMEKGRIVIFAGGTGNPYMSTDTAAALRALEIGADILIMAKNKVDGVYSSDPRTNKDAKKIETITHHDALSRRLNVFDSTALSLCMDNKLPISVFDIFESRNLIRICQGERIGTLIDTK